MLTVFALCGLFSGVIVGGFKLLAWIQPGLQDNVAADVLLFALALGVTIWACKFISSGSPWKARGKA